MRFHVLFALLGLLSLTVDVRGQTPLIESLDGSTVAQSRRVVVHGSGFGASQGTGVVQIAGQPAPIAEWGSTEIHAYVPGDATVGPTTLAVQNDGGISSAATPFEVLPQEPVTGRVDWRFQVDSQYVYHRPGIGSDGTVYIGDVRGRLYAVSPTGALKWILRTGGDSDQGPVVVGSDDTIYLGADPGGPETHILAVNPDGSVKWTFVDPDGQGVIAGPNLGPDGNLYVVTELPAFSAFSLDPQGNLRWNVPNFLEFGQVGQEISFGAPGQMYFCLDGFFEAISLDGDPEWTVDVGAQGRQTATGPDGTIYVQSEQLSTTKLAAYDSDGNQKWVYFDLFTNVPSAPDVGPDGVVYITRNTNQIHAVNPDGSAKWVVTATGGFGTGGGSQNPTTGPIVSPDNSQLVITGKQGGGTPGAVRSFATVDGDVLWDVQLPFEAGSTITTAGRAKFTSDGSTVYAGTIGPFGLEDDYCYLYAIDASVSGSVCQPDLGFGGPGHATLSLCGDALATGGTADLLLSEATPNSTAWLVVSASFTPSTFKGGTLVPVPIQLAVPFATSATGQAALPDITGGGGPLDLYVQFVIEDRGQPLGFSLSNAVRVELLP
jgi:outer membrane protein assembly factor BamB